MWPRKSHKLAPLTKLTSIKAKFKYTQVEQGYFEKNKRIIEHNNLLTYTNFNETFKMHTDASAFQLGAVISHIEKPIAFYSKKINDAQQRYTATER